MRKLRELVTGAPLPYIFVGPFRVLINVANIAGIG